MNRTIAVHEILRYTKPQAIDRLSHPYRNYWGIQRDPADPGQVPGSGVAADPSRALFRRVVLLG